MSNWSRTRTPSMTTQIMPCSTPLTRLSQTSMDPCSGVDPIFADHKCPEPAQSSDLTGERSSPSRNWALSITNTVAPPEKRCGRLTSVLRASSLAEHRAGRPAASQTCASHCFWAGGHITHELLQLLVPREQLDFLREVQHCVAGRGAQSKTQALQGVEQWCYYVDVTGRLGVQQQAERTALVDAGTVAERCCR